MTRNVSPHVIGELAPNPFTVAAAGAVALALVWAAIGERSPAASTIDIAPAPERVVEPARAVAFEREPDDFASLTGDERRLARVWRAAHPDAPWPRCPGQRDRLAVLRADIDDAPGVERVLADKRFGVAMFAADATLLAYEGSDAPSCSRWPDIDDLPDTNVHLSARALVRGEHRTLIVRGRNIGHCGELAWSTAFERRGAHLETILELDEGGERGCGGGDVRTRVTSVVRSGEIVVRVQQRERRFEPATNDYGPWTLTRERCVLRLGADRRFHADDHASWCAQPFDR
jgi:hypothetical protein